MPIKDPVARIAYAKAQYLNNREAYLARSKARRLRLQAEKAAKLAAEPAAPKQVVARSCLGCSVDITLTYRSKWGHKCGSCHTAYMREYRSANAEKISKLKRAWVELHAEHKAAQDKAYATKYPERRRVARAKWDTKNPGATTAAKAINKAERKQRVPVWLSEDDRWMIAQVYELAELRTKMFGFPWHVDHVVPLNGKRVSGLHVPQNLQVIPGVDNLRKGVSFEQ